MRRALAALALLAACSRDERVAAGSSVALDYELSSGGAVIETSAGREPLVVRQGDGDLPRLVDAALVGLRKGEEKLIELAPEQGFGPVDPAKIQVIPLSKFGGLAKDLAPGKTVAGAQGGKAAEGRVLSVSGGDATLDFNHPLAGKALRYKLKVLSIEPH